MSASMTETKIHEGGRSCPPTPANADGAWRNARFEDICSRVQDSASPTSTGKRLYLGLEHLASGQPSLIGGGSESEVKSSKTKFRSGDVLFGKLRPYLRKSVIVREDGICSTDILVFRATEKCIPEFICLLTHTDESSATQKPQLRECSILARRGQVCGSSNFTSRPSPSSGRLQGY